MIINLFCFFQSVAGKIYHNCISGVIIIGITGTGPSLKGSFSKDVLYEAWSCSSLVPSSLSKRCHDWTPKIYLKHQTSGGMAGCLGITLPETTNSSHLKMDGWKTRGLPIFRGELFSFRECSTLDIQNPPNIW